MRIAIRNSNLRMDWHDALEAAGKVGYDGVELVVKEREDIGELLTPAGRDRVLDWTRAAQCAVSSLSVGAFRQVNFALSDQAVRQQGVAFVGDCLRACQAVGGQAILLPHFERERIDIAPDEEATYIACLRQCPPMAEETQVYIAIETSFSVEQLQRIVRGVDSPYVGVYQDTSNAIFYGHDAVDMLTRLAADIRMIHIKDTDQQMLGEGRVPWGECVDAIRKMGYGTAHHTDAGWLVLETPTGEDPIAAAQQNLAFTRELAAQL